MSAGSYTVIMNIKLGLKALCLYKIDKVKYVLVNDGVNLILLNDSLVIARSEHVQKAFHKFSLAL